MSNSIFKTGSKLGLGIALAAGILWWLLPLSFTRHEDTSRGNKLIRKVDSYYRQYQTLPETGDWLELKKVGFSSDELEKAYPEYHRINTTAYELTFVKGFDGPYLTWNSQERKWKIGGPVVPVR